MPEQSLTGLTIDVSGNVAIPTRRKTWPGEQAGLVPCPLGVLAGGFCSQAGQSLRNYFGPFLEDTHVPESKLLCLNLQFFGWNSSLSQSGLPVQQHLRSNLQKHGTPQEIGSLALKLTFKYLHGKKNTFINSAASHQPLRWVNGAHTLRSRTALEPSKSFLA